MPLSKAAMSLFELAIIAGVDAMTAIRKVNAMTEAEIDQEIIVEEKVKEDVMSRWRD